MKYLLSLFLGMSFLAQVHADDLTPEQATALTKQIEVVKQIAADPKIIEAVKTVNTAALADYKDMTQDKWKELPILDPKVRYFSKNPAAEILKAKKSEEMTESFLNAADGSKIAFIAKTTNWSHKGKPKHDDPMAGKTWQGKIEMDESTGLKSIQVSVPVLDSGKPIGSLVTGFAISKLK